MATNGNLPEIVRAAIDELRLAGYDGGLADNLERGLAAADACFMKAPADEPIFVLRAQDRTAAATVRVWAANNKQINPDRMTEALAVADAMDAWSYHKAAD